MPDNNLHFLLTDVPVSYLTGFENCLIKTSLVISSLILITFMFDQEVIL